ncbi:hypothetical protein FN846DRAFT_888066 [Sphaerosporella brunnea]|uniref:Uncharacterized protein n=1 Tax=Sphaerosporella brunnea TaxID=1250544 RepID=A0A5J5F3X3_9PEZI|nr:hypothetical protein FN846DRAFT_888066 [Sphaerosporella brunnea]
MVETFLGEPTLTSCGVCKFANYISQEISNVDKFESSDEDDDDDDDVSFTTAPSDPPPAPPLPLNVKRAQHRTQLEDAEKEAEGIDSMGDFDVSWGWPAISAISDDEQSSDEEDEELEGTLYRRKIDSTHEAKIRELLEDEEDEFLSEGLRALDIRSPITTFESREIAPGEFYGHSKRADDEKPAGAAQQDEGDAVEKAEKMAETSTTEKA